MSYKDSELYNPYITAYRYFLGSIAVEIKDLKKHPNDVTLEQNAAVLADFVNLPLLRIKSDEEKSPLEQKLDKILEEAKKLFNDLSPFDYTVIFKERKRLTYKDIDSMLPEYRREAIQEIQEAKAELKKQEEFMRQNIDFIKSFRKLPGYIPTQSIQELVNIINADKHKNVRQLSERILDEACDSIMFSLPKNTELLFSVLKEYYEDIKLGPNYSAFLIQKIVNKYPLDERQSRKLVKILLNLGVSLSIIVEFSKISQTDIDDALHDVARDKKFDYVTLADRALIEMSKRQHGGKAYIPPHIATKMIGDFLFTGRKKSSRKSPKRSGQRPKQSPNGVRKSGKNKSPNRNRRKKSRYKSINNTV